MTLILVWVNILVSEEGHARLTGFKLTRVAEDSDLDVNVPDVSPNSGRCALPWCTPELLDLERFRFKRSGPRKKSDRYSMGMTIWLSLNTASDDPCDHALPSSQNRPEFVTLDLYLRALGRG